MHRVVVVMNTLNFDLRELVPSLSLQTGALSRGLLVLQTHITKRAAD